MTPADIPMMASALDALSDTFDRKRPTKEAIQVWFNTLRHQRTEFVMDELNAWAQSNTKMPLPANILSACAERQQREAAAVAKSTPKLETLIEPRSWLTPSADESIKKIREILKRPRPHPKAWAQKILDRVRGGEKISDYAVQCALQVAGDGPAPYATRVPGEDDA